MTETANVIDFPPLSPELMKLQLSDYRLACMNPLTRTFRPLSGRILATAPHKRASGVKLQGNLYQPAQKEQHQQEYGLICTVLKVGSNVDPDIQPGTIVVVPWFAGTIMLDETYAKYADLWIFGDGEIMLVHAERV